jgi:acetyl-CoA carboxylase carboxyl transferase subunit alpha
MAQLKIPIICVIIGEGGSGGALAVAVGDVIHMLQYSTYSVISPEGCASILWKSADKAPEAAEIMGITADRLKSFNLVDSVINEPVGGAHRDYPATMQAVKNVLQESLRKLQDHSIETLLEKRLERLMAYGSFKEVKVD